MHYCKLFFINLIIFTNFIFSKIELPLINNNDVIIFHEYYTLSYNEQHEQANWVAYKLTKKHILGNVNRTNNFRFDKNIPTGSSTLEDYKGSGYDRGHLVPAGDMKISKKAMSESFFMSNISPQRPGFNRGIWKKLETKIRNAALNEEELYVVTGPVLSDNLDYIGNNVSVPDYFYKVILDYSEPTIKAIGFILPNIKNKKSISDYAMTIDKIEQITGINFFNNLPDDIENSIESEYDYNLWNFNNKFQ